MGIHRMARQVTCWQTEKGSPGWSVGLGIPFLDDERTHVVACLVVMIGVGAITVGKLGMQRRQKNI